MFQKLISDHPLNPMQTPQTADKMREFLSQSLGFSNAMFDSKLLDPWTIDFKRHLHCYIWAYSHKNVSQGCMK